VTVLRKPPTAIACLLQNPRWRLCAAGAQRGSAGPAAHCMIPAVLTLS
jgi:hypothetical protein